MHTDNQKTLAHILGITEERFDALQQNMETLTQLTLLQAKQENGLSMPKVKGRFDYYEGDDNQSIEIVVNNKENWGEFYLSSALKKSLRKMGGTWSDDLGTGLIFPSIKDLEDALLNIIPQKQANLAVVKN